MTGPILPVTRRRRQLTALAASLLVLPGQSTPARYSAGVLTCAAFAESVTSEVRSQSGSALRQERTGRDGVLFVRVADPGPPLAIEAWYDTVAVWREGPEGRVTPDASGLFGGRYRGTLAADGNYAAEATPFVPDEVMEIADLSTVLADFFPRPPDRPVRSGERYTWSRRSSADTTAVQQDTLAIPVVRQIVEDGWLRWDPARGPVEWERTLTLTFRIEAGGAVKRGVRSTVHQRIRVTRKPDPGSCPG